MDLSFKHSLVSSILLKISGNDINGARLKDL